LALEADDRVRIGQTVVAIGNALGKYANTVTRGILSGLGRDIEAANRVTGGLERLEDILQTDAAINEGNSGGPLLNLDGKVIGVNTALETYAQGLGFAIPVAEVRKVLDSYDRYGAIARPRLGVRYLTITPELVVERKLTQTYGALIDAGEEGLSAIIPNSPAAAAGLMAGDIILEVGGKKLQGKLNLGRALRAYNVSDAVPLKILRNGTESVVTVRLDAHLPY
jgi:serine protease Do